MGNGALRLFEAAILAALITALASSTATARDNESDLICTGIQNSIGLAVDSHQGLYTADRVSGSIFLLRRGEPVVLIARIPGTPTALTVDTVRTIFVATEAGTVFRVSLDGTVNEAYRCPVRPVGLGCDRDGALIVVDEDGTVRKIDRQRLVRR